MPRTDKYWVTDYNFAEEVQKDLNMPEHVKINDLTLREGDQTPGCVFTAEEKIEIAKELDDLGVNGIQLFSVVSENDREALRVISAPGFLKHAELTSLARINPRDIDMAAATGCKYIVLECPGNIEAAQLMGFHSLEEITAKFVECIKYAKSLGLTVGAGVWDMARGCDLNYFERFVKETVEAGSSTIAYADTYGFTMPWTVQNIVRKMHEWVGPEIDIDCHFHNDFGLATANSLAAVAAGANVVDVAMNGLGERVGNAALDEVVVNLALNMNVKTDINLEKLYPLSKKIEAMSKIPLPDNKPITGERCFDIGSGIIVDMLERAIELGDITKACAFAPELVGRSTFRPVFGKGVGTNMVKTRIDKLGIEGTKAQAREISELIKNESIMIKALLPDWRVDQIIKAYFTKS